MSLHLPLALIFLIAGFWVVDGQYEPNWASLDTRPLPQWYDEAKFGIFIHWGVFSVPSYQSEWFWWDWQGDPQPNVVDFMAKNYPPDFTYVDFAPEFQIEFFDPNQWAEVFQASGAKYVVLTSKHHEGFTMWPSSVSWNWNAKDVGPNRDLVGDLASAIRSDTDLHFGLYHSLLEWFHPIYLKDKAGGFENSTFPGYKTLPELYEIVNAYAPDVIWSDGDWEAPDNYWKSTDFIAWLYNESPVKDTVVTNDRWGNNGVNCEHGDFYTCSDRYSPGVLQPHKWENCMTIDKYSWGYRREAVYSDYMTIEELISTLASTVSCGGNLLMNIGPTKDGKIIPVFEERLRQMGQWLSINGESIYQSVPWTYQNDTVTPNIWYTSKIAEDLSVVSYAIVLNWPSTNTLQLGAPTTTVTTVVTMLGYGDPLSWTPGSEGQGISIQFPNLVPDQLPWAWVLKLEGLL